MCSPKPDAEVLPKADAEVFTKSRYQGFYSKQMVLIKSRHHLGLPHQACGHMLSDHLYLEGFAFNLLTNPLTYFLWTWNLLKIYWGYLLPWGIINLSLLATSHPVPWSTLGYPLSHHTHAILPSWCASPPIITAYQIWYLFPPSWLVHYPALWWWACCFHCYWAVFSQLFCYIYCTILFYVGYKVNSIVSCTMVFQCAVQWMWWWPTLVSIYWKGLGWNIDSRWVVACSLRMGEMPDGP